MDNAAPPRPVYLLTIPWRIELVGGVNEVVLNLARQLQDDSPYRPMIAQLAWDHDPRTSVTRGIPVVSLRARGLSGIRPLLGWLATLPADLLKLARFLREERVAAVNFHFPGLNTVTFFLLRWSGLYRGRLLLSFHGADTTAISNLSGFYRMLWRRIISSADSVTTCSDSLRHQLLAVAPHATRVVAIHNGVDPGLFDENRTSRESRRTVLHIGKFEHKKAQDILLNAFQLLLRSLPDANLILVGANGPMLDTIKEQISGSRLLGRVELHVDVPHERIPEFFQRADLFVLPSRAEPFGLTLLEAGAAGVPVVAARAGGIPELLEDGVTGILVPVEDVDALEAAIRRMLTEPDTANSMAHRWRAKVRARWSWRETCRRYLTLVEPNRNA